MYYLNTLFVCAAFQVSFRVYREMLLGFKSAILPHCHINEVLCCLIYIPEAVIRECLLILSSGLFVFISHIRFIVLFCSTSDFVHFTFVAFRTCS